MIRYDFNIDGYWDVILCLNVYLREPNSGFTHSDLKHKVSIVGIGKATSKKQFFNTVVHEIKHLQSHICKYYNIDEDSEDAAYLIGYIAMRIYKVILKFL